MNKNNITAFEDNDISMLHIQLGKAEDNFCEISKADYEVLLELGLSEKWSKGPSNNIRAKCGDGHVLVARVLTDAGEYERVLFRDKDQRNLRPDNLSKVWDPRRNLTNHRDMVISNKKMAVNNITSLSSESETANF